jgi:UDP-glucose 4-epimerase
MPVLAFRFFNVFGPLQPAGHAYAAVVPAFVAAALAGEPLVVHGDGTQTRDFTFVDTVTAVITDALLRRVTDGEPMNLAYGGRTSLLEVIDMIEQLVGHPVERHHVPVRVGDVPHSQADSSRLVEHFGHIEPTPLADGLRATVDWMRGR